MLINLLSTDSYNMFNIELAKTIGLHEAIYLNELINISEKAVRKNKLENGFFFIDRDYVKSRTTFKKSEQLELDRSLESCKLIEVKDKDNIKIDLSYLTTMLMDGNESILKGFAKEVKDKKKSTKADIIRQQLKNNVVTENQELRDAYCEWIDSVSKKRGYMDKKAVIEGQKVVDDYSKRNLDKALKIIEIATINSYINMNWAINIFKRDYERSFTKPKTIQTVQQLSTEVF